MKTKWAYWVCQLAGWGGVVGLGQTMDWLQRITSPTDPLAQDHLFLPLSCLAGLLATHLLRMIILRGQWLEMVQSKIHFRYGMALVVTALLLSLFGTFFFTTAPMKETRLETFTAAILINSSLIGAWMAIYFLIHFYEGFHSARKERALLNETYTVSQLEALRLQRNPHFLFNALNTIRALIPAASFRSSKNGFPPNSSSERTALSLWTWSRLRPSNRGLAKLYTPHCATVQWSSLAAVPLWYFGRCGASDPLIPF